MVPAPGGLRMSSNTTAHVEACGHLPSSRQAPEGCLLLPLGLLPGALSRLVSWKHSAIPKLQQGLSQCAQPHAQASA